MASLSQRGGKAGGDTVKRAKLGKGRVVACVLLMILMTLLGCVGLVLSGLRTILLKDAPYVAVERAVVPAYAAEEKAHLESLSEQYGFSAETVSNMISEDTFYAYGQKVRDWVHALIEEEEPSLDMPMFYLEGMENAIRSDEGFLASVPSYQQRSVAQNAIVGALERACQERIFPLRSQLLALARHWMDMYGDMHLLTQILRNSFWVIPLEAMLACMILFSMRSDMMQALGYIGSALASVGLTELMGITILFRMHLPQRVAVINEAYAQTVQHYLQQLTMPYVWQGLSFIALGYLMLFFLLRRAYRYRRASAL